VRHIIQKLQKQCVCLLTQSNVRALVGRVVPLDGVDGRDGDRVDSQFTSLLEHVPASRRPVSKSQPKAPLSHSLLGPYLDQTIATARLLIEQ
jgi:hypothetical protein